MREEEIETYELNKDRTSDGRENATTAFARERVERQRVGQRGQHAENMRAKERSARGQPKGRARRT